MEQTSPPQEQSPPLPPRTPPEQRHEHDQRQHHEQERQEEQTRQQQQNQQQQQQQQDQQRQQQQRQQPPMHFQPIQQQPFQPHANPMRPIHVSPRGRWISKLGLRIFSMIISIIMIGISASLAARLDIVAIVMFSPPAGLAFIWDFAESICLCVRRGHRGIHPGACVALDLLIWIGYVIVVAMLPFVAGYDGYWSDYGEYYSIYSALYLYRALFSFGIIGIILHFGLFVMACYETNLRNRNTHVIYVQPGPNGTFVYPAPNYPMAQVYQQPMYPQPAMMVQQQQRPQQQPYQNYSSSQNQPKTAGFEPTMTSPFAVQNAPVRYK